MNQAAPARSQRRFDNAAQWLHALGDVPLERIIFDPWPGTATDADLLRLVERDKRLCELIDGTLVEKSMDWPGSIIAVNIATAIGQFAHETNAGVVAGANCTLRMPSSGHVRLPDVMFVSRERMPITRQPIPTLAPDLVVEVLGAGDTKREIDQKLREYFDSGTRLAWIINQRSRTIAVYHQADEPARVLTIADSLDGEPVLPGFSMEVAHAFARVPLEG